jgi:membrane-bound lytic murein transglycosylase C
MRKANILIAGALTLCSTSLRAQQTFDQWIKEDQAQLADYEDKVTQTYQEYLRQDREAYQAFIKRAGETWGKQNVWKPQRTTWVQYRTDWQERSAVKFNDGTVKIEVVVPENAAESDIEQAMAKAVETVVLSGSISPVEMMRRKLFPSRHPNTRKVKPASTQDHSITYTVSKGDSLWKLSRKFNISRQKIASANGIDPDGWLKIGQRLIIPAANGSSASTPPSAPAPERDPRLAPPGTTPELAHQLKMPDGTEVNASNAKRFGHHIATSHKPTISTIHGSDGRTRRVARTQFNLVPNHLRIRAERFRPIITECARKEGVYAPLVYAIIHSESSFNPRARSGVPAYGLMQLVPRSGARDAYRYLYHEDRMVSGSYLYNPENNIRLGVAFLHILDQRYFRRIENPMSRMLCSIAAYNTGAGNVCKAFGAGTSLSRAAPIINSLPPAQVYQHLRKNLPYAETRKYVEKVSSRISLYKDWK